MVAEFCTCISILVVTEKVFRLVIFTHLLPRKSTCVPVCSDDYRYNIEDLGIQISKDFDIFDTNDAEDVLHSVSLHTESNESASKLDFRDPFTVQLIIWQPSCKSWWHGAWQHILNLGNVFCFPLSHCFPFLDLFNRDHFQEGSHNSFVVGLHKQGMNKEGCS